MKENSASDDVHPTTQDIKTNSNKEMKESVNDITVVQETPLNKNEGSSTTPHEISQGSVKENTDARMRRIPFYKSIPASIIVVLLIWKPLFVVLFPGWVYTSNLSEVFLFQGCVGGSTQTVFVFCLLEVLIACVLLKKIVVPALFGLNAWESFDHLKRRKLVGFCVKIIVRASCFIQIATLVAPQVDFEKGLFGNFNIKKSNVELEQNHTAMTCKEAGMTLTDAVAMRAWIFARDDIMAVMVWELACIPELPIDAWLHHLFVILGVCIGTDPQVMAQQDKVQPFIDNVAFFLILGGAVAGLVEICVLMYHLNNKKPQRQAIWMQISILLQTIMVTVLFIIFPVIAVMKNLDHFGGLAWAYLVLIGVLVAVEIKMIWVKTSIVKHARKKAADLLLSNKNISTDEQINERTESPGNDTNENEEVSSCVKEDEGENTVTDSTYQSPLLPK